MDVSAGAITAMMRNLGLQTVEQVARHTRASTGCGGCRTDVAALVERHRAAVAEPLA